MSFEKGASVWYHHPVETWIPTTVLVGGSAELTVKTEDGEEFSVEADSGNVMPLHPSSLTAVPDMVSLGDMNNAALLHNLRLRYWDNDIFVSGAHKQQCPTGSCFACVLDCTCLADIYRTDSYRRQSIQGASYFLSCSG